MAELFPATLQDKFNEASFSYGIGNTSIESSVQVGIPKKRQIYTQSVDVVSGAIDIKIEDWLTLETFYKVTLAGGVKTFNYNHPLTQAVAEWRFVAPPSMTPLGGVWFRTSFNWIEIE